MAVGLPALIWGFAHSAYPNQPFWIRGAEVGLAGIVIGLVMLKLDLFPLLVWHFTVDAVYTSLILVRSTNAYFAVSGALAAGVLLLPLVVAGVLALKRGGFEAERGLTNGEVGSAPPPWPGASSEAPAVVRPGPLHEARRRRSAGLGGGAPRRCGWSCRAEGWTPSCASPARTRSPRRRPS